MNPNAALLFSYTLIYPEYMIYYSSNNSFKSCASTFLHFVPYGNIPSLLNKLE